MAVTHLKVNELVLVEARVDDEEEDGRVCGSALHEHEPQVCGVAWRGVYYSDVV